MDYVSSQGFAWGYIGSCIPFVGCLLLVLGSSKIGISMELAMGTAGVFLAEPVSNVIGGSICFITMLCTVLPELKRMDEA